VPQLFLNGSNGLLGEFDEYTTYDALHEEAEMYT
jgi:hypothetical protein